MKKVLTLLLTFAILIAGTQAALASDDDPAESNPHAIEDLFSEYNPGALQEYIDMKAEHKAFHESRAALRTEYIRNYSAQVSEITAQIADGTITPAEGRRQLQILKNEIQAYREAAEQIFKDKKQEAEAIKEKFESLKESIKNELKDETTDAGKMAGCLDELNTLLRNHIDTDYKYAEMIDEILPQ